MSQYNFSQCSNASRDTTVKAQQIWDVFFERETKKIRRLGQNDFKNPPLPVKRLKRIMKIDNNKMMISAEAPVLLAKAAELFITGLSLRAWVRTADDRRCTLMRLDIAKAIANYDQFDFLIDIVPREELNPPEQTKENVRTATMSPDQVQYYFQLAQQHQAALQQQQTSGVSQQSQQTQIQQAQPQQIQLVPVNAAVQQIATTQPLSVQNASPTFSVPNVLQVQATPAQVLQLQQPITNQVNQAGGGIQILQFLNSNGEIQQMPFQLNPNQLQLIQMQGQNTNQPITIHAAPVQQNASQVEQTATQVSAEDLCNDVNSNENQQYPQGTVFQQASQQLTQQLQSQAVYQIQQVAQASGEVATSGTPVILTQTPGVDTATVQIQAVTADQNSSTDEEQQQSQ